MIEPVQASKQMRRRRTTRGIIWPSDLWEEIEKAVPESERAAFIQQAVKDALMRRAAERLYHYYTTDADALEWADLVGDAPDG